MSDIEMKAFPVMWLAAGLLLIFIVEALVILALGDDNEDELGLCLRGYQTHCQPTLKERLLERVQEWNIMTAVNQTLNMSERFDCVNVGCDYLDALEDGK